MIFVSSSCIQGNGVIDRIKSLMDLGINNIELSGGTSFENYDQNSLVEFNDNNDVNLIIHNYFPPPKSPFVLNLASLDQNISNLSLDLVKRAIELSVLIGAKKYGFHAGFFFNIPINEIGRKISLTDLQSKEESYIQFAKNYEKIISFAGNDVSIYIENNVISAVNYKSFNYNNPLMGTDLESIKELFSYVNGKLLLDLAHLMVSSKTLNLDFNAQARELAKSTDYIHISENDGVSDQNLPLLEDSSVMQISKEFYTDQKTITLETYAEKELVKRSFNFVKESLND